MKTLHTPTVFSKACPANNGLDWTRILGLLFCVAADAVIVYAFCWWMVMAEGGR